VRRLVALAVTAALGISALSACGGSSPSDPSPASAPASGAPLTDAGAFLSAYLTSDGRVLRHDQGDDVVSEGQAYGMLAAEVAGRSDLVRTTWSWTKAHLSVPDGLLAFHADTRGEVLDRQPASDADVLAAYALLRYDGPDASGLHADGRAVAAAVLRHETTRDSRGRLVLVAGPWAAQGGVVNPSYLMPGVFDALSRLTGDPRWHALSTTSVALLEQLTQGGSSLPPDWSRLEGDRLVPTGSGGGSGTPQYGPDAQRVPMWFGAACQPAARRLAAAWWPVLQQDSRSSATALGLDGSAIDTSPSVVGLLAAASSASAAGDDSGAADLDEGAAQVDRGRPSYYGGAWIALAPAVRDGSLVPCS
jgi:endoglucanase